MKTASRILGTAFFLEGFEVQDAPRYGAERRGAPMFAYVRVSRDTIYERGVVHVPDLVVSADTSLLAMPAAGIFTGCSPETVLLIESSNKLNYERELSGFKGILLTINLKEHHIINMTSHLSSLWAGAAARLCGVISKESLKQAVTDELNYLGKETVLKNLECALSGWELMKENFGIVQEGEAHPPIKTESPEWVDCKPEPVFLSAPAIRRTETSRNVKTGLWRTERPVIDYAKCRKCWWNCSVYCPDSVISINEEGFPVIDYAYCKGCLICASECPGKAIGSLPEGKAREIEKGDCE